MPEDNIDTVSRRLTLEVAIIAERLGLLLEHSLPAQSVGGSRDFLGRLFASAAGRRRIEEFDGGPASRRIAGQIHPIDRLHDALNLTREEIELVFLAGMAEEHEGLAAVFATLSPQQQPRPSLGLAAQLFCHDAEARVRFRRLIDGGALIESGLLHLRGDLPWHYRSLELADSLWSVLHGIDVWPTGIVRDDNPVTSAGLSEWLEQPASARALCAIAERRPCTILLSSDQADAASMRALALIRSAGREGIGIALPAAYGADLEKLIRAHCLCRGVVPALTLAAPTGPGTLQAPSFDAYPDAIVVCSRSGACEAVGSRPLLRLSAERLSVEARREMWRDIFPELAEQAPFLASRYPVEPITVCNLAADLRLFGESDGEKLDADRVASAFRARSTASLSGGVKLVRPKAVFADLVLPEDRLEQLREACERLAYQHRVLDEWGFLNGRAGARGVRMLFSGPPGTGKTLAAEILSNALSVDLLVVDISRVVSKWIGETEKNLADVFDNAERSQAVLFFDEADALFGKRTEVSDAHDRYANLETAYLLARLERFEGLAILATNFRQNIDPAFLRRMEFVVDFDEPDTEERHQIWKRHIPQSAPLSDDVNLYALAALYPIVGGNIRNAAVAAGFLAAADRTPLCATHLLHAIRREYEKIGKAFPGVPPGMGVYRQRRSHGDDRYPG